jgi:hypothetical protein
MGTEILYKDIDRAEMPPGTGTFDRPWYWYTFVVPEREQCASPECVITAHAGLVFMKEGDKTRWNEKQDTDEEMDADAVFYCVAHFFPAVERLNKSPE